MGGGMETNICKNNQQFSVVVVKFGSRQFD